MEEESSWVRSFIRMRGYVITEDRYVVRLCIVICCDVSTAWDDREWGHSYCIRQLKRQACEDHRVQRVCKGGDGASEVPT